MRRRPIVVPGLSVILSQGRLPGRRRSIPAEAGQYQRRATGPRQQDGSSPNPLTIRDGL
jgi:hypothetical protein